ncbi:MAG: hypothetical protein OXR07_02370 [Nitrospira sp.]|nr:hypothetical protein [Nitrospira sp.]
MKTEVAELKTEVAELKTEVAGLKTDLFRTLCVPGEMAHLPARQQVARTSPD